MRGNPKKLAPKGRVIGQNPQESGGVCLNQVPSQQHYPSCSMRRSSRNGDRGSGDPPGYGKHYSHRYRSGGGCGGLHVTPGDGNGFPPDDPNNSSSEFGR